jgi:isopentenyldiphosphate isomerase
MAAETITTYLPDRPDVAIPMDRAEFYREQIQLHTSGQQPNRAAGIVNIFIFDSQGELFVQKRSDHKAHNAGLLDKTIGGHIRFGDTNEYTVMVETVQELQVPSITLRTEEDFAKTHDLLKDYLSTVAIIRHIDTELIELNKNIKGQMVPILNKVHLYFGVYDGAVKTVDREAKGVLLYSLADLAKDIETSPALFTDDLHLLLKKYRSDIDKFLKQIQR